MSSLAGQMPVAMPTTDGKNARERERERKERQRIRKTMITLETGQRS